jgi:hypothetical protein
MNNLTPLQEVTAQIYCARIIADAQLEQKPINLKLLANECIDEAAFILEATKPEPLEWYKQAEALHQSGVENFTIAEYDTDINGDKLVNIEYQLRQDGKLIGYFFDLDIAKKFAEHIRTR